MVRSDDSHALYEGSDIAADGRITQRVVFRSTLACGSQHCL
jgi:hypothetical protein